MNQEDRTVWAEALPRGTSAQKVDLNALTVALDKAEGRRLMVCTGSWMLWGTCIYMGRFTWREVFFTSEENGIQHQEDIQRLLAAICLPKTVSVVHVLG